MSRFKNFFKVLAKNIIKTIFVTAAIFLGAALASTIGL